LTIGEEGKKGIYFIKTNFFRQNHVIMKWVIYITGNYCLFLFGLALKIPFKVEKELPSPPIFGRKEAPDFLHI
jgi:hypothetical protein